MNREFDYNNKSREELIQEIETLKEKYNHCESRFRTLVGLLPEGVYEFDANYNITYANEQALKLFGYTFEDIKTGVTCSQLITPSELDKLHKNLKLRLEGVELGAVEYTGLKKDGSTFPVLLHAQSIIKSGNITGFRGIAVDLSHSKNIEKKLQKSNERYHSFISQSMEGIYRMELDKPMDITLPVEEQIDYLYDNSYIAECNQAFLTMYNTTHKEMINKRLIELHGGRNHPVNRAEVRQFITENYRIENIETMERTIDNKVAWFSNNSLGIIKDNKLVRNWGTQLDITEEKKAKEALLESRELYYKLYTHSKDAIIWLNATTGRYVSGNPAAVKMFGLKNEKEFQNFSPAQLSPDEQDDGGNSSEASQEMMQTALKNGSHFFEWTHQNLQGRSFASTVLITKFELKGEPFLLGTIRDISEQKLSEKALIEKDLERHKLESQLSQAQKMEALGTLAGGIAHDFNNILGIIMGYTDITLTSLPENDESKNNLLQVMKASNRAKDMVTQILAFSRKGETTKKTLFLNNIIQEVLNFLKASLPSTIQIKTNIKSSIKPVFADATQMNQILLNLCTNAAHAMREQGGFLEISLSEKDVQNNSNTIEELFPGKYQVLTISDTGCGIDKNVLQRIFEPYYTTKAEGEGTGMGLAVVYGIIKNQGGSIKVFSEEGTGTTFEIYLPIMEIDNWQASDKAIKSTTPSGTEKILFVDDEIALVELSSQILTKLGYRVESRTSSLDAYQAFKANPDNYDLIITDMTMPNMTGIMLAGEIHKIRPDIPIILCTGFSDSINPENFQQFGIRALIMKPIVIKKIATIIREVLDKD